MRILRLMGMLLSEALSARGLDREPEPAAIMEDRASVKAFHEQGNPSTGPMLPVYHVNAVAISRLTPYGGRVVDFGSGSSQFLMYLAQCREDLDILGVDLSREMVSVGREAIQEAGLDHRIRLLEGNMIDFGDAVQGPVDAISSVFSFHHLPRQEDLQQCLESMARLAARTGCALWAFDHVRPRLRKTAEWFPEIFSPKAPRFYNRDSTNSLLASFSFEELSASLDAYFPDGVTHSCSSIMRLFQAHWKPGERSREAIEDSRCRLRDDRLPADARRSYRSLRWSFRSDPLISGAPFLAVDPKPSQ